MSRPVVALEATKSRAHCQKPEPRSGFHNCRGVPVPATARAVSAARMGRPTGIVAFLRVNLTSRERRPVSSRCYLRCHNHPLLRAPLSCALVTDFLGFSPLRYYSAIALISLRTTRCYGRCTGGSRRRRNDVDLGLQLWPGWLVCIRQDQPPPQSIVSPAQWHF